MDWYLFCIRHGLWSNVDSVLVLLRTYMTAPDSLHHPPCGRARHTSFFDPCRSEIVKDGVCTRREGRPEDPHAKTS